MVEPVDAFGITWGTQYERISYLFLFACFVMFIVGLVAISTIRRYNRSNDSYKKAIAITPEQYVAKAEGIYKTNHIQCPKCKNWFDKDNLKRYTMGTAKNVAKFAGHVALKEGGSMLGDMVSGGNEYASRIGKQMGGEISKAMGLTNYDGWQHQCPNCKHRWE